MSFQIQNPTYRWLVNLRVLTENDYNNVKKSKQKSTSIIEQQLAKQFENGLRISKIVEEIYLQNSIPIPNTLVHLKQANHTAAMLYNWNILNESLKKIGFQIDSQTKNMVINGDREHLNMVLRKLQIFYQKGSVQQVENIEDSLESGKISQIAKKTAQRQQKNNLDYEKYPNQITNSTNMKQSLTLSRSEDAPKNFQRKQIISKNQTPHNITSPQGDLLEYIVNQLMSNLNLTRKQAVALLSDNNKYLAHVLVKGIKGQFNEIDLLMQKFYTNIDYIIQKMLEQNDMCFFFLQIIKPSLLSKSEQIAQWGCRILTKIAYELAEKQMLPLAYDWFVRDAGGLSTTILALSRHPKLNQHVVGFILEFARYNVTELFTIELKKITNNDNLTYTKFILLIFQPLVDSKLSAEQLLTSGAVDYWVEMGLKNSQNDYRNSNELRLYSIQFLIKIWKAYPLHIQQTLDVVNQIMINIKKGILESSQIMRFSLLEIMFNLLEEFASKKNPYASVLYKKLTFLFVQNHEQEIVRQFILRNMGQIFKKFTSIPVQIFLEPFIKQVKISQNKSYFIQLFDMEFIKVGCQHKKLKANTGIQLYDLLAKIKLNNYCYVNLGQQCMDILLDRFIQDELFFDYTVKLVKISLAMLYSTLKHKKQFSDHERIQAQKRAEIINFIISLIQRENQQLNEEIKHLVIHVKIQIENRLTIKHKGIQRILSYYNDIQEAVMEAMQNIDETQSNATSNKTKSTSFHLPKIQSRNQLIKERDQEISSQHSYQTNTSKFSRNSNGSRQDFQIKDYTQFADDQEKKFMKQHNIVSKKKKNDENQFKARKMPNFSKEKDTSLIDPKLQSHIQKLKERKQLQQQRKFREKQILQRKKQILKQKIAKQLQQRNIKEGVKGHEKDVQVQVIFQQNQLSQKLFTPQEDEVYYYRNVSLDDEEQRDHQSVRMVLRKNMPFLKKVFTKYACAKVVKKDFFQEKSDMTQTDLLRLCKQKNLQRNKTQILQILKESNNKNIKQINIETFPCFMENLCIYLFYKQKQPTHTVMGDFMRRILKKMTVGQNLKLDDEEDQQCKALSEKIRYNPQTQLPEGFKKVTQRVYYANKQCSYPTKRALKNESFSTCFEILNQILQDAFKFQILQEEVRFTEQLNVVHKKQAYLPPKPSQLSHYSKQKQNTQKDAGLLLKDTEKAPIKSLNRGIGSVNKYSNSRNKSTQKENLNRSRPKIINAAEKKKIQQSQQQRIKRQHEQQMRKLRQLQVKKKLQREKQQREKQKQLKKQHQLQKKQEEEQKRQKQLQQERYYKQKQKEKLEKYRKQQQQKERQQREKRQKQRQKQQLERKEKLSKLKTKQEQKRQQQREKLQRQRQMSQEKKKKQKEQEQKKKQQLRKQVLKKLQNEKSKYEIQKTVKQLAKQVYSEPNIKLLFDDSKEQLKALFNYGRQFNEFKLGGNSNKNQILETKGWLNLCQQMYICDIPTANKLLKQHLKQSSTTGFTYEEFQETLFNFHAKPLLEKDLQDYSNAVKTCLATTRKWIDKLQIPKDKLLMKDFFLNLKNQKGQKVSEARKRKQSNSEIEVTNAKGQKENWELEQQQQKKE